jgi:hypothetical protein
MSAEVEAKRTEDEQIVRELETVYDHVLTAVAGSTVERTGVLNSLRVMLEPAIRPAKLLRAQS